MSEGAAWLTGLIALALVLLEVGIVVLSSLV